MVQLIQPYFIGKLVYVSSLQHNNYALALETSQYCKHLFGTMLFQLHVFLLCVPSQVSQTKIYSYKQQQIYCTKPAIRINKRAIGNKLKCMRLPQHTQTNLYRACNSVTDFACPTRVFHSANMFKKPPRSR